MADKTIKIPQPTPEQQLALTRAGVSNHRLVWDRTGRKWTVKKLDNVTSADITFDEWEGGEKSYTVADPNAAGMPRDIKERVTATEDPLAAFVEKHGLRVVTDPKDGRTYLEGFTIDPKTGKRGQDPQPFFIYLDSQNKINISEDYDAIKAAAIKDMQATGELNALFQDLYNKKRISKETFEKKDLAASDFNAALVGAITEYSISTINNRQFGVTTQAPNFLNFLKGIGGAGGGDANLPERRFQDISKDQLNAFIDSIYLETIGRKPTDEQRKAKMKELNKIVKEGILTTTRRVGGEIQTRQTGGLNEEQEALRLRREIKEENPLEAERRQAFSFMDQLQKIMSGGM